MKKKNNLEKLFDRLFPINRSIMGNGFRKSLKILTKDLNFNFIKIKTNTKVFDWKIPEEWNISNAFILTPQRKKICDFKKNNLHIMGYSIPINKIMSFEELKKNIYYIKKLPEAIPYITSYYKKRWGFSIRYKDYKKLKNGKYKVYVNSSFKKGNLVIGEKLIKGKSKKEILFSTYLCHPSMANNELSGPIVLREICKRIKKRKLNYSYRFVITSETIGAIAYLKKRGNILKKNLIAGYQLTCLGDKNRFNYKKSKIGNSYADFLAIKTLKKLNKKFKVINFFPTGSDERQYNSPRFNLPVGSIMRTPYDRYKEYHTSLDNKKFISFKSIEESINVFLKLIEINEKNIFYKTKLGFGEPQLGKRKLYSNISAFNALNSKLNTLTNNFFWILSLSDGKTASLEILDKSKSDIATFQKSIDILHQNKLIAICND